MAERELYRTRAKDVKQQGRISEGRVLDSDLLRDLAIVELDSVPSAVMQVFAE